MIGQSNKSNVINTVKTNLLNPIENLNVLIVLMNSMVKSNLIEPYCDVPWKIPIHMQSKVH